MGGDNKKRRIFPKIFACGALMNPTPIGVGGLAAGGEKNGFWGSFCKNFPVFFKFVPPHSGGVWGGNFYSPPILKGSGGKLKIASPPSYGGKKGPLVRIMARGVVTPSKY